VSQQPDQPNAASELEELRAKVESLTAQLVEEYKMASIGRLLASIAHEINSPIGSILSNSQVILRALERLQESLDSGDPAARERAKGIADTCHTLAENDKIACERISEIVRGLKTFARGNSADLHRANLNEQIRDTLRLTNGEFQRRIAVETDFGEIPPVECHPNMLNQVFLNLLVNAGQAIEGEGKITVCTRHEGDGVHISISDTGHGIRPEDRPKIFAGGFTTKAVGVGTGLGLSISRKIVEEVHGGSIGFESQVGVGTTFHIRVPIQQAKAAV
jgi:two-component system NtrC family sensor kinase